jgi:hypothetical protein
MKERSAADLLPLVQDVHRRLRGVDAEPPPVVTWYRYVSTKSTVREDRGRLFLRLSDHLQDAPEAALRGIVGILLCRLYGVRETRVPRHEYDAYEEFARSDDLMAARTDSHRRRGRKHLDPIGAHRSLLESYLRVLTQTGLALPDPPRLSWSKTASRSRFGHQDEAHDCIVLSRVLDDPKVPEFVLDFVVYHELLHIAIPPRRGSGSRMIMHPREFRAAERRFPLWKEAETWLDKLARRR